MRLLIDKHFQPAQLLLREMWDSGGPVADEGMPVMLAWSYLETGRPKTLRRSSAPTRFPFRRTRRPIPVSTCRASSTSAACLPSKEGRKDDARGYYDKFLALSGPDPLIWGEEKKVRQ